MYQSLTDGYYDTKKASELPGLKEDICTHAVRLVLALEDVMEKSTGALDLGRSDFVSDERYQTHGGLTSIKYDFLKNKCIIRKAGDPEEWRLMKKDTNEEVIASFQGILCKKDLPPLSK